MPPSRRAVFGLFGTATAALLAGCTAGNPTGSDGGPTGDGTDAGDGAESPERSETTTGERTETTTDDGTGTDAGATDDGGSFEMRLVGSETDRTLFTETDVATVGAVRKQNAGGYGLSIALSDEATREVTGTLNDVGVPENPDEYEFVLRYDGEEESRFGIAERLAQKIADGEWDGEFLLMMQDEQSAEDLRESLVEG